MASVGVGTLMGPLDGSILNVALPTIGTEFQAALTSLEWVVMGYLLVTSATLLIFGRMGDLYGQKTIYINGFAIFVIGSLLCSLAPSLAFLIGARIIQAVGASMMIAMGTAIVTRVFPTRERGMALGIISMVVAVGLASGPTLGGILVETVGWRSIFWINIPIGIVAILWAWRVIPAGERSEHEDFDLQGAFLFLVSLMSVLLIASQGSTWGWNSPAVWGLGGLGVVTAGLFLRTEMTVPAPMVDLSLFRNRLFVSAAVSCLLNFMAQFSVTFLMPFYLQNAMAFSARDAGLVLSTVPVVMIIVAPLSGALSDRYGSGLMSPLGMIITALGVAQLSQLTADSTPVQIVSRLLIFGLGTALFGPPNNSALMGSAPRDKTGIASGILALMRNMGMVLGIALSGAIVDARLAAFTGEPGSVVSIGNVDANAFVFAQQGALVIGAALAGFGVLTSLVRSR